MDEANFKPARAEAKKAPTVVVADIDAILSRGGEVRLHGKSHPLEPVTTLRYLEYVNAVSELQEMEAAENVAPGDLIAKALAVLQPIIPTLTQQDIENCTQPQMAALFSAVRDQVQGRFGQDQKKN